MAAVAAPSGTQDTDLTPDLEAGGQGLSEIAALLDREPFCFDFFQAVRLLQRIASGREPVGRFVNPAQEAARFGAHPSLVFPASQIQSVTRPADQPARMTVNFMGLIGPLGVLPLCYTELLVARLRARDTALRDFLDLFHHRVLSLFYQAWQKYRFTVAYERGERDRFSHHLLDLIGLGTPGLQERQAVADDSLIYYAGLLAQFPRSASALEQILIDYFDVPVAIEQFAGAWYRLDAETQCCFREGDSFSEQVGWGAVVGDEIWDQQSRVRVRLGPLSLSQYLDFLPNGTAYRPLGAWIGFFAGRQFDFEVQLVLRREEVPACELGAEVGAAPQLGWVTWMKTAPFPRDPADAILRIS